MFQALIILLIILQTISFGLKKENIVIVEHYHQPELRNIGMFGHTFNTFLSNDVYYSLSLTEAIFGYYRAGYAVANVGVGYRYDTPTFSFDQAIYLGAGGGGHLSQYVAGGLSLKYQLGLMLFPTTLFRPVFYLGYIFYPYGNFDAFFISTGLSYSFNIKTNDLTSLSNQPAMSSWELVYKSYTYDADKNEMIELLGGERKKYFDNGWFYGESGFAAISSGRHGYIEIGLLFGQRILYDPLMVHYFATIGAGGGGGADASEGSGFLIQSALQIGVPFVSPFEFNVDLRYTNFVSGKVNSLGVGFSLRYLFEQY